MISCLAMRSRSCKCDGSPSIPRAVVTPFADGGGPVDLDALDAHVSWLHARGIGCIAPLGTNGEGPSLSLRERQAVIEREPAPLVGNHGDRLYCVYAAAYAEQPGASAWAGIGWVRDETGRGLFVEHETGSEDQLMELLHLSLADLNRNRGGGYGPVETAVASAHYEEQPACALVLASYAVASWDEFGVERID